MLAASSPHGRNSLFLCGPYQEVILKDGVDNLKSHARFGRTRLVTFLLMPRKRRLAPASRAHGSHHYCKRQAKADVAYALSRSRSRTDGLCEAPSEHVTGVTVRHEGKPSGFGPVRLVIGVIHTAPNSGESSKAFPARGQFGFKPSQTRQ